MLAAYSWRIPLTDALLHVSKLQLLAVTASACFSGAKLCTSCQRTKPLEQFYTAGRHKGGSVRFHSHCKSCKLENEAAQRMQPRKGGQEAEMSEPMTGELGLPLLSSLPSHLTSAPVAGYLAGYCSDVMRSRVCCRSAIAPSSRAAVGRSTKYVVTAASGAPPGTATNDGPDARSAQPSAASSTHGLQAESCLVQ